MGSQINQIVTELEAKTIGGGTSSASSTKCATKAFAQSVGCLVGSTYSSNQLVRYIHLSKSDTKYRITCRAGANGSVTADKSEAKFGETVRSYATPDSGYVTSSFSIKTDAGSDVSHTSGIFAMPADNVTVSATFKSTGGTGGGGGGGGNVDTTNFHIYFSGDDEQIDGFVSNEEDVSLYTLAANATTIPSTNENSSSALNSTHSAELNSSMYLKDMFEMFNYKDHITQLVMTYLQYQNNYAFDISDYDITYNYNVIRDFFDAGFDNNKVKKLVLCLTNDPKENYVPATDGSIFCSAALGNWRENTQFYYENLSKNLEVIGDNGMALCVFQSPWQDNRWSYKDDIVYPTKIHDVTGVETAISVNGCMYYFLKDHDNGALGKNINVVDYLPVLKAPYVTRLSYSLDALDWVVPTWEDSFADVNGNRVDWSKDDIYSLSFSDKIVWTHDKGFWESTRGLWYYRSQASDIMFPYLSRGSDINGEEYDYIAFPLESQNIIKTDEYECWRFFLMAYQEGAGISSYIVADQGTFNNNTNNASVQTAADTGDTSESYAPTDRCALMYNGERLELTFYHYEANEMFDDIAAQINSLNTDGTTDYLWSIYCVPTLNDCTTSVMTEGKQIEWCYRLDFNESFTKCRPHMFWRHDIDVPLYN